MERKPNLILKNVEKKKLEEYTHLNNKKSDNNENLNQEYKSDNYDSENEGNINCAQQ